MSRALVWLACVLFCAAVWSLFFSLTAFGTLLALAVAFWIAGDLLWHIRYRQARRRHPSQLIAIRSIE